MTTRGRAGHSLLELMVALAMLAIVLAAVLGTTLRSWRANRDHGARAEARTQLEAGMFAVATDLRPLSATAGDLAPGEARDSAVEIRALVVTGAICDTAAGRLAMQPAAAPDLLDRPTVPAAGDEAWSFADDDSGGRWHAATVTSARRTTVVGGRCARDGSAMHLALSDADWPHALGAPVRVTRRARWSAYRTADGWFLGRREWSPGLLRFDVVQPVAGPLAPYGAASGLELRYFDAAGGALPAATTETARVARLEVTLRAPRGGHAPTDSQRVVLPLDRGDGAP